MKKQLLSLALLYALPVMPSAAQPPVQQETLPVDADVHEAAVIIENMDQGEILQGLTEVEAEFRADFWITDRERAEIIATLGVMLGRNQLNKHNFKLKVQQVITRMVTQRYLVEAQKHLYNPGAERVAISNGRNAFYAMNRTGIKSSILSNASGFTFERDVARYAHNSEYAQYRKCNSYCY